MKRDKLRYLYTFLLMGFYYFSLDIINQYFISKNIEEVFKINYNTVIFNSIWITLLFILYYVLKPKVRKWVFLGLNSLYAAATIANYFLMSYFKTLFSWRDILLSGNGFEFLDSIFKFINGWIIILIIICVVFIILLFKIDNKKRYAFKSKKTIVIALILIGLGFGYSYNYKYIKSLNNKCESLELKCDGGLYYTKWIDSNKLVQIGGLYDYLIRDFYRTFLYQENTDYANKYVNNYIKENSKEEKNKYTGLLKDKNLIFVMMESMDDWMIDKDITPTICEMQKHGYNFTNHYSPVYFVGKTANTEFMGNTGVYPNLNGVLPNYGYAHNTFDYALPSLFKNADYDVNSYHRSPGKVYNRGVTHISLGYSTYNNYEDVGIDKKNMDLDSYMAIDGYDNIVNKKDKFMSFIITYSPHSPYTYNKKGCENAEEVLKLKPELDRNKDEEKICALSGAMDTDMMFKIFINKLKKDNLLDNTVIVAFTDHPNEVVVRDDETSKLNKTAFFIYDSETKSNQIKTVTNTLDIVPTLKNLFGLKGDFVYPGNDALINKNGYIIFKDYTYYNGKDIKPLTKELINKLDYSKYLLVSDYYKKN